jgi:hypothetical protein
VTALASITWHDVSHWSHTWILVLKYPIAFVSAWVGLYLQRWRKQRAEATAQSWPMVDARIGGGVVKPVPKTKRFLATLSYTYFVGEYRIGKYIHEFQNKEDAEQFVKTMKDKHVPIRYNPANPEKSVLEESSVQQHVLLAPRFG